MKKVLFLDLDGVLNTARWHSQAKGDELQDEYGYKFDPIAVTNLAKIIDETGADIVISSSWKSFGFSELADMWSERGLPGILIDITPNTVSDELLLNADLDHMEIFSIRGMEIKEWLDTKGKKVSHYAIIDDMDNFLPEQHPYFVQTNPEVGITEEDSEQAIMILNQLNTTVNK